MAETVADDNLPSHSLPLIHVQWSISGIVVLLVIEKMWQNNSPRFYINILLISRTLWSPVNELGTPLHWKAWGRGQFDQDLKSWKPKMVLVAKICHFGYLLLLVWRQQLTINWSSFVLKTNNDHVLITCQMACTNLLSHQTNFYTTCKCIVLFNSPFPNYASVPVNNNLKLRFCVRKYSNCMKTWHEASTSGYCSWELKHNSEMGC